ncbi:MAG: MFS transporter [Thermomicrobiales bacterium]|nr:MFS transporter [Thermomicrobiales bacterium]
MVAGVGGFADRPGAIALSQPARSSLTLEMVGRRNIANANGLNSMAMGLMQGVAPAVTGVIISGLRAAAAHFGLGACIVSGGNVDGLEDRCDTAHRATEA